jgi:hypothetical protein
MTRKTDRPMPVTAKKPYRAPTLKVHGDFRTLTAAKGGVDNDGGGKPRTKASGGAG